MIRNSPAMLHPSSAERVLMDHDNYVTLLKEYLTTRSQRPAGFSLRSFAKLCNVSVSRLSMVLRGKGHLSKTAASKVAKVICDSQAFFDYFIALVDYQTAKNLDQKQKAYTLCRQIRFQYLFEDLDSQRLRRLSWKHFALQFSAANSVSKPQLAELSSRLGLSLSDAQCTLDELLAMGALMETPDKFISRHGFLRSESRGACSPIRQFHKSLIEKALEKIDGAPVERRFLRSAIFTLNASQYGQLCDLIVNFVTACSDCSVNETTPHDDVYALCVQLFPLSQS